MNIGSIRPAELEQFLYDHTVSLEGTSVKIETEELEVSSFLKLFYSRDAKIEIYSAHSNAASDTSEAKP